MFTSLLKGKQHKYTHRKPHPSKPGKYIYYYEAHHGGGITNIANLKEGAKFKLKHKKKTGHFHIDKVDGNLLHITHDETGQSMYITKNELSALLRREHKKALETHEKKQKEKKDRKRLKASKEKRQKELREAEKKYKESVQTQTQIDERLARRISLSLREPLSTIHEEKENLFNKRKLLGRMVGTLERKKEMQSLLEQERQKEKEYNEAVEKLHPIINPENKKRLSPGSKQSRSFVKLEAMFIEGRSNKELNELVDSMRNGEDVDDERLEFIAPTIYDMLRYARQYVDGHPRNREYLRQRATLDIIEEKLKPFLEKYTDEDDKYQSEKSYLRGEQEDNFETMPEGEPREQEDNFETIPDEEGDGNRLSTKDYNELRESLGKARMDADPKKLEELQKKEEKHITHTGDEKLDGAILEGLEKADREEDITGVKETSFKSEDFDLSIDDLNKLVKEGKLKEAHRREDGTVSYTQIESKSKRHPNHSWILTVKEVAGKVKAFFKYSDFSSINNAPRTEKSDPPKNEKEKDGRDLKEIGKIFSEIEALIKKNPNLLKDPRVMAMLGSGKGAPPKTEGATTKMFLEGVEGMEEEQEIQYRLIEAGDAIPSHNPFTFDRNEKYPPGVQERSYDKRPEFQYKVQINAGDRFRPEYHINNNPDAVNGPPILTPEGIALGGNSRIMTAQILYANNPKGAQAYKDKLTQDAHVFGFTDEDVKQFKNPLLVRVFKPKNKDPKHLLQLSRAMNESQTMGLDLRSQGRSQASRLTQEAIRLISVGMENAPDSYSFNRWLTKPSVGLANLKKQLFRDGILTVQNANQYIREDGTFNALGRDLMEKILVGHVVKDPLILNSLELDTVEKITTVMGRLASAGLTEKQRDSLSNAIAIYNHAYDTNKIKTRMKPKDRHEAMQELMAQSDLFGAMDLGPGQIDYASIKDKVRKDPLANTFLQILTANRYTSEIEDSVKKLIKLTGTAETNTSLFGDPSVSFEEASKQIADDLANKYGYKTGLYKAHRHKTLESIVKRNLSKCYC